MLILKILIVGFGILFCAILLNVIASKLSVTTWYEFLQSPQSTKPISYVWLFIVYPASLGTVAYLLNKILF